MHETCCFDVIWNQRLLDFTFFVSLDLLFSVHELCVRLDFFLFSFFFLFLLFDFFSFACIHTTKKERTKITCEWKQVWYNMKWKHCQLDFIHISLFCFFSLHSIWIFIERNSDINWNSHSLWERESECDRRHNPLRNM